MKYYSHYAVTCMNGIIVDDNIFNPWRTLRHANKLPTTGPNRASTYFGINSPAMITHAFMINSTRDLSHDISLSSRNFFAVKAMSSNIRT